MIRFVRYPRKIEGRKVLSGPRRQFKTGSGYRGRTYGAFGLGVFVGVLDRSVTTTKETR